MIPMIIGADHDVLVPFAALLGGLFLLCMDTLARDTLANLFAGFFIIADAPYSIGDHIVLGSGERGGVVNVGIRSTRLRTRDDVEIIIPNPNCGSGSCPENPLARNRQWHGESWLARKSAYPSNPLNRINQGIDLDT